VQGVVSGSDKEIKERYFMAQYEEISIDQGTDVAITMDCFDETGAKKDLTNYTVYAKLKKNYNSEDFTNFTAIINNPTTDGGITLSLTSTQTDTLKTGRHVYDVELHFIDSDGNTIVERILEGRVQVMPSVTK